MSDRTIQLTRRRLLAVLIVVALASAATGVGTVALFTDAESSDGNSIETGTLELSFGSGGSFDFDTSLAPTQSTNDSVTLVNGGSVSGSLDVNVSYSENDGSPNDVNVSAEDVAQNVNVTVVEYGGSDALSGQNLPANPTLYDLANNDQSAGESTPNDLVNLADPGGGTGLFIELELANVGNDYQNDGLDVTFEFDLNQNDAQ